ncbi:MAG TPA: hypothetical protein PLN01_12530, partial [Spirochaetota bacterium]|nr:hypothetical protein [Spirochaetota bacterium]
LQMLLNQCDPEKDKAVIENITDMKYRIERSQTLYAKTLQLKKKGQIRKAKISMRKAISLISRSPVFYEMRKAYRTEYRVLKETPPQKDYALQHPIPAKGVNPSPSSITTPVLIVLKKDITISEAIYNALRCDDAMLKKLTQQFASSKIKAGKKRFENPTKEGIYIVQLTPKGNIKSVKRVTIVKLNPYKYQNQMYLKNSYCVSKEKSKSL